MSLAKAMKSRSGKTGGGYPANNRSLANFTDRQGLVQEFLKFKSVNQNEKALMSNIYPSKTFVDNIHGRSLVIDEGIARSVRSDVDPIWLLVTPVEYSEFIQAETVTAGGTIPLAVLPEAHEDPDDIPPRITNLDCNEEYPVLFKSVGMRVNLTNSWLTGDQVKRDIQRSYEALKVSFRRSFCRDAYLRALEVIPKMDVIEAMNQNDNVDPKICLFMDQFTDPFDRLKLQTQQNNHSVFVRHAIVPTGGFDHMAVNCNVNHNSNKALSTTYQLRNQFKGIEQNLPAKKITPVGECNGVAIFEETGCSAYIQPSMRQLASGMQHSPSRLLFEVAFPENLQDTDLVYDFNAREPVLWSNHSAKKAFDGITTATNGVKKVQALLSTLPAIVGDFSVPIGEAITSPASSYFVQTSTNALDPEIRVVRQEAIAIHPTKLFPGTSVRVIRHAYYTSCEYNKGDLKKTDYDSYLEVPHSPLYIRAGTITQSGGAFAGLCKMVPLRSVSAYNSTVQAGLQGAGVLPNNATLTPTTP